MTPGMVRRLQIAGARHAAYEAATAAEYEAAPSTAAPGKVALMFLIRSDLPTEPLWRLFLDSATAAVRGAAVGGRRGGAGHSGWEQLFSVYVHPAAGRHLPRGSLFARHEVPDRVGAVWGNHSIVDAERALLRAALHDPLNQRFVLLSGAAWLAACAMPGGPPCPDCLAFTFEA